jgi:hypothetical protein
MDRAHGAAQKRSVRPRPARRVVQAFHERNGHGAHKERACKQPLLARGAHWSGSFARGQGAQQHEHGHGQELFGAEVAVARVHQQAEGEGQGGEAEHQVQQADEGHRIAQVEPKGAQGLQPGDDRWQGPGAGTARGQVGHLAQHQQAQGRAAKGQKRAARHAHRAEGQAQALSGAEGQQGGQGLGGQAYERRAAEALRGPSPQGHPGQERRQGRGAQKPLEPARVFAHRSGEGELDVPVHVDDAPVAATVPSWPNFQGSSKSSNRLTSMPLFSAVFMIGAEAGLCHAAGHGALAHAARAGHTISPMEDGLAG